MERLQSDIKRTIALKLSPPDLVNLCLTNKHFNDSICNSPDFWRQKLMKDYPLIFEYYVRNKMIIKNPKNLYIRKFTEVYKMIENFVTEQMGTEQMGEKQDKEDLEKIIYSAYKQIKQRFPKEIPKNLIIDDLKAFTSIGIDILEFSRKILRFGYFLGPSFNRELDKLLVKLLTKDKMYGL